MLSVTGNNLFLWSKNNNNNEAVSCLSCPKCSFMYHCFQTAVETLNSQKKKRKNQSQQHFPPHTAIRSLPLPEVAYLSRLQVSHALWPSHDPLL